MIRKIKNLLTTIGLDFSKLFLSLANVPKFFADEFTLKNFSFIDDNGEFHENVKFDDAQVAKNFGCNFGCGIYELRKGAAE